MFVPLGFTGNLLLLEILSCFPLGFKGNRFHYWNYFYLSLLVLKDSFCLSLLVLQGIYYYWKHFSPPDGFKGNRFHYWKYYLSLLVLKGIDFTTGNIICPFWF